MRKMPHTILVTGANGQLGMELRLLAGSTPHRWIFTDVNRLPGVETIYLDITNVDAVRLICASEKVDVIVNCAAYTNVEKAEDDPVMADLLNHKAAAHLAAVAKDLGATLVHISTDYVFGGDSPLPLREDWPTDPLGVYGATKLQGELAIQKSGCKWLIFRTAWLYSPFGKNFVKTMYTLTRDRAQLKVVFDQIGTPTYAADLAALIVKVIGEGKPAQSGLYHFTDEGICSWYDLAVAVRDLAGHTACDIAPCHTSEYPTKARRPAFSVLDKSKVKKTFNISIPHWYESLVKCINRM